jgi:hypothetical protein
MRGEWLAKDPVFSKLSPDSLPGYVASLKNEDPRKAQIAGSAAAATRQSDAFCRGAGGCERGYGVVGFLWISPGLVACRLREIHTDPIEVQKFNAVKDSWNRAGQFLALKIIQYVASHYVSPGAYECRA